MTSEMSEVYGCCGSGFLAYDMWKSSGACLPEEASDQTIFAGHATIRHQASLQFLCKRFCQISTRNGSPCSGNIPGVAASQRSSTRQGSPQSAGGRCFRQDNLGTIHYGGYNNAWRHWWCVFKMKGCVCGRLGCYFLFFSPFLSG